MQNCIENLYSLSRYCGISRDRWGPVGSYILTFNFGHVRTTITIAFGDYSDADVIISHMTTLPADETRNSYGSRALEVLLMWAQENNLKDIRAVQVGEIESFWEKNGFVKMGNVTNDFVYRGLGHE